MKTTRAKFNLSVSKDEATGVMNISGSPVYSEDPDHENKAFTDATPSGSFSMTIAKDKEAQKVFEPGTSKQYYIDIIPADVESKTDDTQGSDQDSQTKGE